jgi:hypothetical protein
MLATMTNPITALVKRRLAKLKPAHPYFEPFDACMRLWNAFEAIWSAEKADRPFSYHHCRSRRYRPRRSNG